MHRKNLIKKLQDYFPTNEKEKSDKIRILDFINAHEDCFERSLFIGHITGSCWLENHDRTKFLLTLHKKFECWLQLGGHADVDSDIINVSI